MYFCTAASLRILPHSPSNALIYCSRLDPKSRLPSPNCTKSILDKLFNDLMFPITIRKIMLLFYWIGETEMEAWTDLYNWLKDVGMNIFDI